MCDTYNFMKVEAINFATTLLAVPEDLVRGSKLSDSIWRVMSETTHASHFPIIDVFLQGGPDL